MNAFQTNLFNCLQSLVQSNEAFYAQRFESNGHLYDIFNYRLASYTDFLLPSALECRGVMFEVDSVGNPIELKALPFFKFFNAFENPFVMDLDFGTVESIYVKADGSLMSTYVEDGKLKLKSKGSISSEQAMFAMDILRQDSEFYQALLKADIDGYTVNLEYMSPNHRIVLGYMDAHLKVLGARSRQDGKFVEYDTLLEMFGADKVIEKVVPSDPVEFCSNISSMTDIEGFVVWMADGRIVKIKCDWYLSLHHAKDSVNNPRRLFEAILDEGIDDLRSLFHTDLVAMKMIDEMQVKVDHVYNSMVKAVEEFYNKNKELDRKSFALLGQKDPSLVNGKLSYFGLAMNLYIGKENDYKAFLKGKWKELGLHDTALDKSND